MLSKKWPWGERDDINSSVYCLLLFIGKKLLWRELSFKNGILLPQHCIGEPGVGKGPN